ncbi:uncharacterized protein LOC118433695 [Folsomia candida]|uniref:uncharacterized protein LOC118433695 n=1 Tax=Folsomia candida TaxID=158441 RepID=UPI0016053060|nr:uncharacterized protein LOC118433695 [Folsomia candida]
MVTPARSQSEGPLLEEEKEGVSSSSSLLGYDFPLPTVVLIKIFDVLPVEGMLNCRLVCQEWNSVIHAADLLDIKSCFVVDGRREDSAESTKCNEYMDTSSSKNYLWSHLKLRRVVARHCTWLFRQIETSSTENFTGNVTTLELLNSTLNWAQILQLLIDFENLTHFYDKQDIYCWDYATFNTGIEEDEVIPDTASFQQLRNSERLSTPSRLRVVRIHRSQLIECTTYLKILQLRFHSLSQLEIHTDQNFAPQRGNLFYTHLGHLLAKVGGTLRTLCFPYKLVCPSYDFRTTDEHRIFREFLNFITENEWVQRIRLPVLEELSLQYGVIPMEGNELVEKLAPFLIESCKNLRNFYCGYIHLEGGMEASLLRE